MGAGHFPADYDQPRLTDISGCVIGQLAAHGLWATHFSSRLVAGRFPQPQSVRSQQYQIVSVTANMNEDAVDFRCEEDLCSQFFADRCELCFKSFCENCISSHSCQGQSSASSSATSVQAPTPAREERNSTDLGVKRSRANAAFQQSKKISIMKLLTTTKKFTHDLKDLRIHPTKFPLCKEARASSRSQSWVWDHYMSINTNISKCGDERVWGRDNKSCNLCHSAAVEDPTLKWAVCYGEARSTGHLARHLDTYHPEIVENHNKGEAAIAKAGNLDKYLSTTVSHEEKFMEWIVDTYQPLNTCESESFRDMMRSVNKNYPNLDRHSIMSKLDKREQSVKLLMKNVLQDEDVSITLDHWTSSANVNYVAQTAHFIDGDFKLTKLTLACTQHKGSSTGADSKQVTSHSSDTIIVY